MNVDLRQLIEYCLRQVALFEVPNSIEPKHEPAAVLFLLRLDVEVFRLALLRVVDLPESHDRALLASTDRSAKVVCLAHRQPEGRYEFRRRKQKVVDA